MEDSGSVAFPATSARRRRLIASLLGLALSTAALTASSGGNIGSYLSDEDDNPNLAPVVIVGAGLVFLADRYLGRKKADKKKAPAEESKPATSSIPPLDLGRGEILEFATPAGSRLEISSDSPLVQPLDGSPSAVCLPITAVVTSDRKILLDLVLHHEDGTSEVRQQPIRIRME